LRSQAKIPGPSFFIFSFSGGVAATTAITGSGMTGRGKTAEGRIGRTKGGEEEVRIECHFVMGW
jgi:hypothetical protein